MPFAIGETVAQYQLLELLGQGGMATVFKAYHARLDRYVAIKALHPAFMEDPNFLARFEREAQLVARLEHPNIVPIYDFSEHEGRPYLVMKYVEGETLKERLKEGRLSQGLIYKIITSVGAALSYAHSQGILHRDVKPSNVLIGEDERIYLADFGLARIAEAGESTISTDMMLGTPQYVSPEQAMGRRDLDQRTDIYSFGVMVYEMVVGKVPFTSDTPYSIIHDHIYTPLPLPRQENPEVPEDMERVLVKALEKKREDRFQTVDEMVDAFQHAIEKPYETRLVPREVLSPLESETHPAGQGEPSPISVPEKLTPSMKQVSNHDTGEIPAIEKKAKRKKWPIIVAILAAACLCFGALVMINRASNQGLQRESQLIRFIGKMIASRAQLTLQPQLSVEEAQRMVDDNPEDPFAYLQLAEAYWRANQPAQAEDAFNQALQLAGDNREFFVISGDRFLAREMYALAAFMYRRALALSPGPPPEEIISRLREATYLGAVDPAIQRLINEPPTEWLDQQFLEVIRARGAMLRNELLPARETVNRLMAEGYHAPELHLLDCELLIAEGRLDEAREKLLALQSTPDLADWILREVEKILNKLR